MARNAKKKVSRVRRNGGNRLKSMARFQLPKDAIIDYKNVSILQKFINDRGKIVPRRISGVSAKIQRQLTLSIKRARFLALLNTGGVK